MDVSDIKTGRIYQWTHTPSGDRHMVVVLDKQLHCLLRHGGTIAAFAEEISEYPESATKKYLDSRTNELLGEIERAHRAIEKAKMDIQVLMEDYQYELDQEKLG